MSLMLIKFGTEKNVARRFLDNAAYDDSVVLIQDGIFWGLDEEMLRNLEAKNINLYAIKEDLEARGYSQNDLETVTIIDYNDFIELLEKFDRIIS